MERPADRVEDVLVLALRPNARRVVVVVEIFQLLAMILAPLRAWPSAFRAASETSASSPQSDQLSQDKLCHEQWCGAIITSYESRSAAFSFRSQTRSQIATSASPPNM